MKRFSILIFSISFLFFYSCSSSVETVEEEEIKDDDIYVFDEVPEDTFKTETRPTETKPLQQYFAVQIGAFTTKDRAETFATESRSKLNREVDFFYSNEAHLFLVHLKPYFNQKQDAEKLRNELWKMEEFKDAWVTTVMR